MDGQTDRQIDRDIFRSPNVLLWGNTNRVVSNRDVSKGPLYPSKTKVFMFFVV